MPSERVLRRVAAWGAGAAVVLYYLFFTWKSVGLYFDQDDMMNLYFAWSQPLGDLLANLVLYWRDPLRPLGGLFYRAMFAVAGFNPVPFHVVYLALGLVNLGLCCWFVRLVSQSWRVVAFAALLFAFHTRLMEIWFRPAAAYDALCFTFFYLAACLYIAVRGKDQALGWGRIFAIVLCFTAAMDAKEVAIALPPVLIAWELLFAKFRWRNLALPVCLGMMAVPYLWAKMLGPRALTANPYYQPEYTLARFSESWGIFLGYLFVRPTDLVGWSIWGLLFGTLIAGVLLRSRPAIFGWLLIVIATLPMSFVPRRGGFALYVSYAGWVLIAGLLLERLVTLAPARWQLAAATGVFVVVGWRFGKMNLRDQRLDLDAREWLYASPRMTKALAEDALQLQPGLPKSARILLADDGFATDEYTPLFILRLLHRDATLVVDRVKTMTTKPANWDGYQFVIGYEQGHYRQLKPPVASKLHTPRE